MIPTANLALVAIGTGASAGLAIFGWGRFTGFFAHPALIALVIPMFVLSGVALFAGGNLSSGVREDLPTRWVIAAFGRIGLLAAYPPAYTDRKQFWTLDCEAIRWLGVVLFAAGGPLRIWAVFVLGCRFSGLVAIQSGHTSRDQRCIQYHPSPQLSRPAREFVRVGTGVSFEESAYCSQRS